MWCWYYRRRMEEKLGGILEKRGESGLRKHLKTCPGCAGEWKENVETRSLLRSWTMPEPPSRIRDRVMAKVLTDPFSREHKRFGGGLRWGWVALQCGVAVVLAVIAFQIFFGGGPDAVPNREPGEPGTPGYYGAGAPGYYPDNYMVDLMNDPRVNNLPENEKDMLMGTVVAGQGEGKLGQD